MTNLVARSFRFPAHAAEWLALIAKHDGCSQAQVLLTYITYRAGQLDLPMPDTQEQEQQDGRQS